MTQSDGGFVLLWRSLLNHWVGQNHRTLSVWVYLLLAVNWKESVDVLPRQRVKVKRGQHATSSQTIATKLGLDRKTVERILKDMAEDGMIVLQTSHQGTIVTLCNYDEWQAYLDGTCPTKDPLEGQRDGQRRGQRMPDIRTREQSNKLTTLSPRNSTGPKAGKKPKGLSDSARAQLAVDNLIGIVRDQFEHPPPSIDVASEDALATMKPETRSLFAQSQYPSWKQFVTAYTTQAGSGYGPSFQRDLVKSFRALIKQQEAT